MIIYMFIYICIILYIYIIKSIYIVSFQQLEYVNLTWWHLEWKNDTFKNVALRIFFLQLEYFIYICYISYIY